MDDCLLNIPRIASASQATRKVVFETLSASGLEQDCQNANSFVQFFVVGWDWRDGLDLLLQVVRKAVSDDG